MRHTAFRTLGLLSIFAHGAFSFKPFDDHSLRSHPHKHRNVDVRAPLGPNTGSSPTDHPTWGLTDSFQGQEFYDKFTFETLRDPTRGRVNYIDMQTAIAKNLTRATRNRLFLHADSTTVLDPDGPGRDSIRMQSKKQWAAGVTVLNLVHMPEGCGTWPAYWMTQHENWPINGEIDILEGVHDQGPNHSALHTLNNCTMAPTRTMTGSVVSTNCSYLNNWNQGCPVRWDRKEIYGPSLNAMGGGWFVTERTSSRISIWFWSRKDKSVPPVVKQGKSPINTKDFGVPFAVWESSDTCDFNTMFGPENIIINLTLCGEWAGQTPIFNAAGCPGTCVDHVNKNPAAFKDAYWEIASIKVYSKAL